MTHSAIAVSGLRKAFKEKTVLDGIDLDVHAGTVFSLLGPNGAGKTTTVNVLTTLMKADAGTVRVAGHDVATETKAVRAAIGVTGQFAAVDELLTGQENLQLMADLKHLGSAEARRLVTDLLERFDPAESAQKLAVTYSGGMRRKLDLAMTLVGNPQIIFLDEPTTGLDPRSRRTMWEITGYAPLIAQVLVGVADLALRRDEHEQAARLLAASAGVRGLPDRSHPDAARIERAARRRLGEARFAEATRQGTQTSWSELVATVVEPGNSSW